MGRLNATYYSTLCGWKAEKHGKAAQIITSSQKCNFTYWAYYLETEKHEFGTCTLKIDSNFRSLSPFIYDYHFKFNAPSTL
jgi:hypothetical protein